MYRQFFIVLAISLTAVISIMCVIIHFIDRHLKRKKRDAIFVSRMKARRKNSLFSMYQLFSKFPLTKGYMNRITRRYELVCPGDKKDIAKKSMMFALIVWIISILLLISYFLRMIVAQKLSLYEGCSILYIIWLVNAEITYMTVRRGEKRILKQLDMFLSDIRHIYYINGSVDDAILEAIETAGREIKIQAKKIYEILTSENIEEEVSKYNDATSSNYLKMFLAQCVAVMDYGDKTIKGESLFLTNIRNLKTDINVELRKLKLISFLFMGINAEIIAPILFLEPIRKWAVSNLPELTDFYYGRSGIIIMILIFVLSIVFYTMAGYLKENHKILPKSYDYLETISRIMPIRMALENYKRKHYGKIEQLRTDLKRMGENITPKQLIVKQMLYAALTCIFGILLIINLHSLNRHNIVSRMDNVDQLTNAADDQMSDKIGDTVKEYVNKFKNVRDIVIEDIEMDLASLNLFKSKTIISSMAGEIEIRVRNFQNEYLKWYEVLIIILISYLAYCCPNLMIKYRKEIMKINMKDEVIQFQSIILMLMYIDRMTIPRILEFMEGFAVIFKDSIRTCLNEYDAGDIEALTNLRNNEIFIPFQRLVDNFLISDKIGIEQAFDEIVVERINFMEQRKQDNEILITNKGTLAKYIAFFYVVLVILIYLAVPFTMESLRQFQVYSQGINNIP